MKKIKFLMKKIAQKFKGRSLVPPLDNRKMLIKRLCNVKSCLSCLK